MGGCEFVLLRHWFDTRSVDFLGACFSTYLIKFASLTDSLIRMPLAQLRFFAYAFSGE